MNLSQFVKHTTPYKNGSLNSVKQVNVYYVYKGRNTWNSNHSATYDASCCMYSDLKSAKKYCEDKRVQGSTFYISKLPALAFYTKYKTLIVTEINSNNPLSMFSLDKFLNQVSVEKNNIGKLEWTTDLMTLVNSFDIYSGSWRVDSMPRNSVLMFDGSLMKLEVGRLNELSYLRSKSVGSRYCLQWLELKSDIIWDGTQKIVRFFIPK